MTSLRSRQMSCHRGTSDSERARSAAIDFNYDTQPLTGRYPVPFIGPFGLLQESSSNHWGKLAFRWIYWHLLLPGRPIPLPARISMAANHLPAEAELVTIPKEHP